MFMFTGVYPKEEYPRVLIDISAVKELKGYTLDQNLIVNAGTTLTEFLEILNTVSTKEYFGYLKKIYDHVLKVAHIPVRNVSYARFSLENLSLVHCFFLNQP